MTVMMARWEGKGKKGKREKMKKKKKAEKKKMIVQASSIIHDTTARVNIN